MHVFTLVSIVAVAFVVVYIVICKHYGNKLNKRKKEVEDEIKSLRIS